MRGDLHTDKLPRALGRYEVAGFLASGGMAEVLLGRLAGPSGFDRPVVLKRILAHLARQPSFVDMFLDEARIVARLRHPNVVQIQELAVDDGELFMVMEYLEGESLSGLVRRLIARGETLDPALAAYIVAEVCAGLHAAHELCDQDGRPLGVVHRDVSPQNVFVTFDGRVKVLDFGIATAQDRVTRTTTGELKGKLEYMSPEQCMTQELDRRSDVFNLGIVLYELLTLRRLFKRATPIASLKAITEEDVIAPSRLSTTCPPELDAVCLRALARDRAHRYATAADMRRELVAAVKHGPGDALAEERLAASMRRLFADRKEEKDEMLRRVREGSNLTSVPSPDVDDAVEIPVVVGTGIIANELPTTIDAATTADVRRRRPIALGAAAAVVLVAAFGIAARRRPAHERTVTTAAEQTTAVASASATVGATPLPSVAASTPPIASDSPVAAMAVTKPPAAKPVTTARANKGVPRAAESPPDPLHTKW